MRETRSLRDGILLMIAASLCFATSGALVKSLTRHLPSSEVVFFRFLVSCFVLAPWMWRRNIPFRGNDNRLLLFRSLMGFIAGSLSFYVTSKIALADATILNYSSPVLVAVLSALFFGERVSLSLSLLILLAAAGCALILKPGFDVANFAGVLGVVSAFFSALAYLGIKRLHRSDDFRTIVFHYSLFSTCAAFVLFGWGFERPGLYESLGLVLCGVAGTAGQILMTLAYGEADASMIAPYSYATILFSAIFGVAFWGEVPDFATAAGAALLVVAGLGIHRLNFRTVENGAFEKGASC